MAYDVGSTNNRGNSVDKKAIAWFVESWSWYVVLPTSSTGTASRGSKDGVIPALQTGSPLRSVVHEAAHSYSTIEEHNIAIKNLDVATQSIRYISDENGTAVIQRRFKSSANWRYPLTSTNGNQQAA